MFKASDHKFKQVWTGGTTAIDVNHHDISNVGLKFKSFAEIITGKWRADLLVRKSKFYDTYIVHKCYKHYLISSYFSTDVIGVVSDMGYCQFNEENGKKLQVSFALKDL